MKKIKRYLNIVFPLVVFNLIILLPLLVSGETADTGLIGCSGPDCNINHLFGTLQNLIAKALQIGIGFVAIIFAYAGWTYMTANGDSAKIKQANGMFTKAAIGFVIALSAFLIVKLLLEATGAKDKLMIDLGSKNP